MTTSIDTMSPVLDLMKAATGDGPYRRHMSRIPPPIRPVPTTEATSDSRVRIRRPR